MATKKAATPVESSPKPKTAAKAPAKSGAKSATTKAASTSGMSSAGTSKTAAPAKKAPTRDEIARLAHRYWQERGSPHGSQHEDWLRAEAALKG